MVPATPVKVALGVLSFVRVPPLPYKTVHVPAPTAGAVACKVMEVAVVFSTSGPAFAWEGSGEQEPHCWNQVLPL